MFICSALPVIQLGLLLATPGSHRSFQSLATPLLFSAINVFLVILCFQTNELDDDDKQQWPDLTMANLTSC